MTGSARSWRVACAAFLLFSLVAGHAVARRTPPFSNPDEGAHYLRAHEVAHGHWVNARGRVGVAMPCDEYLVAAARYAPIAYFQEAARERSGDPACAVRSVNSAGFYPPVPYAAAALALRIGEARGWSVVQRLQAARWWNAVLAALVCTAGLLLLPCARGVAVLLLLAPMSFWQRAALSNDSLALSLTFLFFSAVLNASEQGEIAARRHVALAVIAALLGSTKNVYGLLCLSTVVLWPSRPAGWRRATWAALLALPAVIALATNAAWTAAVDRSLFYLGNGARPAEQILHCAAHPFACGATFLRTFWAERAPLLHSFVGVFPWVPAARTEPLSQAFGAVLVAAALGAASRLRASQRAALVGIAALTSLAIEAPLYLTYTPVGYHAVLGLQGRYFLPPAWFLLGAVGLRTTRLAGARESAALALALALPAAWDVALLARL